MELIQFIIWLIVIVLTVFILSMVLFKPNNFKQKITNSDMILWSLVVAIFAGLIFGLIAKPYISYNYCKVPSFFLIFGSNPSCGQVAGFILYTMQIIAFLIILLLLVNSVSK